MRIAIATTSYPRDGGDPSGHFVRAHARALAREGAEVVVLAAGLVGSEDEHVGAGRVRVVGLGGGSLFGWPGVAVRARENPARLAAAPWVAARARAAALREGPFDRLVAHWIPCAFVFAALDAPLLVVAHGADVRLLVRLPSALREWVLRDLLARGARFQVVSNQLRDELLAVLPDALRGALAAQTFVEAAPFELLADAPVDDPRPDLGLDADAPYVAWLGRLVEGKRPALAIDAAALAGRTLVIVGDGPLRGELARHDALSGSALDRSGHPMPPRVIWTGRLPRDRAIAVMRSASAVLHTSAAEGASTVIREARALGVPVVACESGDVVAWAARDTGIRLAAPDAASIAASLTQACSAAHHVAHHGGPR